VRANAAVGTRFVAPRAPQRSFAVWRSASTRRLRDKRDWR